jgi:hypothetical protein
MVNLDLFSSRLPNVEALKAKQDIKGLIRLLDRRNIDTQWQSADALGSLGTISHAAPSCRAQPQENSRVAWRDRNARDFS